MTYKIATWNINSIRLRMPLLKKFMAEQNPDVICLQETKVEDRLFPKSELEDTGFDHIAFSGEKSYNGVAIISKLPLKNINSIDFAATGHKRHISAVLPDGVELHNFYIPAGGDIPDVKLNDKFAMKLDFVDAMADWAAGLSKKSRFIAVGDFNIAPLEHDVWSHKQLLDVVSHTPVEVEKLGHLQKSHGWVDILRSFVPEPEKLYSWWSYRARDWELSNRGRRLDHIWLSPNLAANVKSASIIKDMRGWQQPSDHVAVVTEVAK